MHCEGKNSVAIGNGSNLLMVPGNEAISLMRTLHVV